MDRATPAAGHFLPANDIHVPVTLELGQSFETRHWRLHRYDGSVVLTHLEHAGQRGKKCLEIAIVAMVGRAWDAEPFSLLVPWLLHTMVLNPAPETMAAFAKDAVLTSLLFQVQVSYVRGIDVEVGAITIETELVTARFSMKEFTVKVTALHGDGPSAMRQDSHLYNRDKRSVPKAYAWARANADRIGSMTRTEIFQGLTEAGAKVQTWG